MKKNAKTTANKALSRKKSSWGRYLVVFLISAWMFVLGVLVGRGTAPVKFDIPKLSRKLEELKVADQKEQLAPVEVTTDDTKTKAELEFYEELKKSGPVAFTPKPEKAESPKKPAASKPTTASAPTSAKEKDQPDKTAIPKIEVKPPPAESTGPVTARTDAGDTAGKDAKLTIQAASLKDLKDADALVKKLKGQGYPAYKTLAVIPDKGIWFRIRVGHYGSREAASGTIGRLKKDGYRPLLVEE